jgi:MFS-type transporter involved in bile tolerance (Atg22 family)
MAVSINNVAYAYILATVFGLYIGISETVQRAIIPRYVSTELRGTAYGFYSLVIGVCFFVSNITFGFIWDNYNIQMAVVYSTSLSFCATLGMIAFMKNYAKMDTHSRS